MLDAQRFRLYPLFFLSNILLMCIFQQIFVVDLQIQYLLCQLYQPNTFGLSPILIWRENIRVRNAYKVINNSVSRPSIVQKTSTSPTPFILHATTRIQFFSTYTCVNPAPSKSTGGDGSLYLTICQIPMPPAITLKKHLP